MKKGATCSASAGRDRRAASAASSPPATPWWAAKVSPISWAFCQDTRLLPNVPTRPPADSATARWNSPLAGGEVISMFTDQPPADSPMIVTLPGSPPKAAMLRRTHSSAATWSIRPKFPTRSPPASRVSAWWAKNPKRPSR